MNTRRCVIAAISFATLVKLYLALFTFGTNDVSTWQSFLVNIRNVGGAAAYHLPGNYRDPFVHPPFMVHVLVVLGWIADKTGIGFPFLLRFPGILADIGSVFLTYRLRSVGAIKCHPFSLVAMALCPISIFISGFHGNTDPVMIFFVILSLYLIQTKHSTVGGGIFFGMALNMKVVPLILGPAFLFHLKSWRARMIFVVWAMLVVTLSSMPYLMQDPVGIMNQTLGYKGSPAPWGLTTLLLVLGLSENQITGTVLRLLIVVLAFLIPMWMSRKGMDAYTQFGAVIFSFLFLAPGFGVQYLAWTVPFILTLELGWTIAYYLTAGTFIFVLFDYWSSGDWYFANIHSQLNWGHLGTISGYLCWALIGELLIRYSQVARAQKLSVSSVCESR